MTNQTTPKRKYKIVFCRGKALTKLALLGVIVLSTVALIAIHNATQSGKDRLQNSLSQAIDEENRQADIQDNINDLGSPDGIENIASSELGLGDPDTIIIVPQN